MKKLQVLLIHNYYQQPGGEDVVFEAEKKLLQEFGHDVIELTETNYRLNSLRTYAAAKNAVWSSGAFNKVYETIAQNRPDIAHVHNTWLMFSPSIYYALQSKRIPVVQTLHNYRLLCPNATLFRKDKVCEDCMNLPFPLYGIFHKCYRNSFEQSSIVAAMLSYHRLRRTWQDQVDCYIALSKFAMEKFIQGGLPVHKLTTKPNFIADKVWYPKELRNYVLYVGRLSPEKGIQTLVKAFESSTIPLYIAGDGPDRKLVLKLISQNKNVSYLGYLEKAQLEKIYSQARFLVIPSTGYENFPMNILEAFRSAIPVVASRIGSIKELINDGETGLLFHPGDQQDLISKIEWLWNHPEESIRMGKNARQEYEKKYTPERNYEMLMSIYRGVLDK